MAAELALANLDSLMRDIEENFSISLDDFAAPVVPDFRAPSSSSASTSRSYPAASTADEDDIFVTAEQLLSRRNAPLGQSHITYIFGPPKLLLISFFELWLCVVNEMKSSAESDKDKGTVALSSFLIS